MKPLLAILLFALPLYAIANPLTGFDTSKRVSVQVDENKYQKEIVLAKIENGKLLCRVVTVATKTPPVNTTHQLDVYGCDSYETGNATEN